MTAWTADELDRIGTADELDIATLRPDGELRNPVTIWVVRHGDDLYVRAYRGPGGAWFRGAMERHAGHIQSGGVDQDVTLTGEADPAVNDQIDAAYRAKYHTYSRTYVDPMLTPEARSATGGIPARRRTRSRDRPAHRTPHCSPQCHRVPLPARSDYPELDLYTPRVIPPSATVF